MPFFSVIIPAYNSAKYICKALESIQNQSFTDYELIVVCDACLDDTFKIAHDYTDKVYITNFGSAGAARNVGIEHATGEWILFMDDDDWWLHEYVLCLLGKQIEYFDRKNLGAIAFSFIWKGVGYIEPVRSDGSYWPAVWSKVWKKEAIEDCRFSDKWSTSDMDFNAQVYAKWAGSRVIIDWDMPIYYYNFLRKGSISEGDGFKKERIKF